MTHLSTNKYLLTKPHCEYTPEKAVLAKYLMFIFQNSE